MSSLKRILCVFLLCAWPQLLRADERSELKAKMAQAVATGNKSLMADCAREAGKLGIPADELKSAITQDPKMGMYDSNFQAACSDLRKAELFLGGIDQQIAQARLGMKAQAIKEGFKKLVEEQAPKPEDGVYKVIPGVGQYQELKGVFEAMAAFGKAAKKGVMTIEDLKTQRANAQRLVEELGWNGNSKGLCYTLNKGLNDYKKAMKGWDSDFDTQYNDGVKKRKEDEKKRKDALAKAKKDAEDAKRKEDARRKAEAAAKAKPAVKSKPVATKKPTAASPGKTYEVEGGWVKDKKGKTKVTYVKNAKGNVVKVIYTHYDTKGNVIGTNTYNGDNAPAPISIATGSGPGGGSTGGRQAGDHDGGGGREGGCSGKCN